MTKFTTYLETYNLSELDIHNLRMLEYKTGKSDIACVHEAVLFCKRSLEYAAQGYHTTVFYKTFEYNATTMPLQHRTVADAFNARSEKAKAVDISLYRSSPMLQDLAYIKHRLKVESDSTALGYALEYAAQMVEKLENANNGKNARVFFSLNNSPREVGYVMKHLSYNISLRNKFSKSVRKTKQAVAGLFKKKHPALTVTLHSAPR